MKKILAVILFSCTITFLSAQNNSAVEVTRLPVFDVHIHVSKVRPGSTPLCPWFLTSMPGSDPNTQGISFMDSNCLDPLMPAKDDEDMKNEIVKRIKEMNLTMVAFGDPGVMRSWMKEVPEGRIIPGIGIGNLTVEQFRDSLESGFYKVMAEVAPQ